MTETIAEIMLGDHERINRMLLRAMELAKINLDDARREFVAFQWHMEKHIFVEDNAIFSLFEKFSSEDTSEIFELMNQHVEIELLTKEYRRLFEENKNPELDKLLVKIKKHFIFEAVDFYQKLDGNLGGIEKKDIIEKIHKIII